MPRVTRYFLIGCMATFADIAVFSLFFNFLSFSLIILNIVSFQFAIVVNFILGRYFVFQDKNGRTQIIYFTGVYLVSAFGLVLNTTVLFISVTYLEMDHIISKTFAAIPVFVWNYLARTQKIYIK